MEEIEITHKDEQLLQKWKKTLGETEATVDSHIFRFMDRTSIRMVQTNKNEISSITLKVEKLDGISNFLKQYSIHFKTYDNALMILPQALRGTKIKLIE